MAVMQSDESPVRITDPDSVAAVVAMEGGVAVKAIEPGAKLLVSSIRVGQALLGVEGAEAAPRLTPAKIHFPPR